MLFKLLACDVFTREICHCVARCPNTVTPVFTPKGEHNTPERLNATLQKYIDETEQEGMAYDAILLGYGLCGNAVLGLTSQRFPLVIPRAHDCTTVFLGSKAAFQKYFGDNPSQCWAAVGYAERSDSVVADAATREHLGLGQSYEELVATYGEESARYLYDAMHAGADSNQLYFIDVPETREPSVVGRIRSAAEDEGKELFEIPGSLRLVEMLLAGNWPDEDFLVVPRGQRIAGVYDMNQVIETAPAGDAR